MGWHVQQGFRQGMYAYLLINYEEDDDTLVLRQHFFFFQFHFILSFWSLIKCLLFIEILTTRIG